MFNSNSDPFIQALKSFGYLTVRLPKADIAPLQILSKNGKDLERLGFLEKLLMSGGAVSLPALKSGTPTANINGRRTGDIKIGLGLSILGNIIGAMGGSTLGLEVQYRQATSAAFEFNEVTEDKIEIVELDQYLGDADINPASVYINKLLEADQIYVTTSVIKSSKFTFEVKTNDGAEVKVEAPIIQQVVGGNVNVSTSSEADSKLTYEGKIPLVFGFQAVRIYYDDGNYTAFAPTEDVTMKSLSVEQREFELLMIDDTFAKLTDCSNSSVERSPEKWSV
jgi:hypothetical protein